MANMQKNIDKTKSCCSLGDYAEKRQPMDNRKNNGGHKTAGRKKKNDNGDKITFIPTDEVLRIWKSWKGKPGDQTAMIEQAILAWDKTKQGP